jgi:ABC-type phosphate transport system substrate-binding protein
MSYKISLVVASGFLAFGIHAKSALAEVVVAVGPSAYSTIFSKMPNIEKEAGIKVTTWGDPLKQGSAETYMAVMKGEATAAVAALSLEEWAASAKKKFPDLGNSSVLTSRVIGHDKIQIATNKNLTVKKLTLAQISRIFTGDVKNWKEFGGPDTPIKIVLVKTQAGTTVFFNKKILGDKPMAKDVIEVQTVIDAISALGATPGAVTFATAAALKGEIGLPEHPTIGRPLSLITKGRPNDEVLKLITYIKQHQADYNIAE